MTDALIKMFYSHIFEVSTRFVTKSWNGW